VRRSRDAAPASHALAGKLRILVLNWLDRENPRSGGAETHLHEVFGRLASYGHDVTALVSGWPGCASPATLDGMQVHRSGRRYTFSLTAPRDYRRLFSGRTFDVVVEDLNKVPLFSPFWVEAPVVLLAHHLFGSTAFQAAPAPVAAATWLLEQTIPRVYAQTPTIAVSESTEQDLVERGLSKSRIVVVHNGVDVDRHRPDPGSAETERPTLLFLGRLKRYKRVDLVLEAVAALAREGLDVELVVAGEGEELEPLRAHASRLGIEGRVRLLGFVDERLKLELLRRAWVHVLTSTKEGWGLSNLEAAACGTPSVASDSPGLRESVLDGETGFLVPHGDMAALTAALGTLLRDRDLRARMGRRARTFAEGFGWDAAARAVEGVLARVVAAGRPG
jgi:glycosyltransferase involved in cell wall biosynthesis